MIFNTKKEVVFYINKLLNESIDVSYHNLKFILDCNNIDIQDILFINENSKADLSLSFIKLNEDETVEVTINAYSWNQYLPEIYQNNELLKNFLFGIQTTALTQENIINNISEIFKPETTEFIDWLSSWFGIKYHSIVDEEAKRMMLYNIIELYKCRGTKGYFIKLIKTLTNVNIEIVDFEIYNDYQNKDTQKYRDSFKVVIPNRISKDIEEEKSKLKIITNIINKEKPINTKAIIEYIYISNIADENDDENIVDYHNEYQDDYDYEYLNQ